MVATERFPVGRICSKREQEAYIENARKKNGWIKAKLFTDLHVTSALPAAQEIDNYVVFFNEQRSAYSLYYLMPKQYRETYRGAATT